jgi:hypothetical protein
VWYVVKLKESNFHITGLLVKASWWGTLKILDFFCEGPNKLAHCKKEH